MCPYMASACVEFVHHEENAACRVEVVNDESRLLGMTESVDSPPSSSARKVVEEEGEDAKSIRRVGSVTGVPSCRAPWKQKEKGGVNVSDRTAVGGVEGRAGNKEDRQ